MLEGLPVTAETRPLCEPTPLSVCESLHPRLGGKLLASA